MTTRWKQHVALLVVLAGITLLALSLGSSGIHWVGALEPSLLEIRGVRTALALFCGAGLGVSGAIFQSLLRNPLAEPYIVGVSGGAAMAGVIAMVAGASSLWWISGASLAGAILATLVLIALARMSGRYDAVSLLLAGVVFNAFAAAVVTLIKTLVSATAAHEILFWLMGSITYVQPQKLIPLVAVTVVGVFLAWRYAGLLNILLLDDDTAASLGVRVARARIGLFVVGASLVAATVAVIGMVGFVGLIVPHIARRTSGTSHEKLLPASALLGAGILVAADIASRATLLIWDTQVPTGAVTAFVGAPFFLYLLLGKSRAVAA